MSPDYHILAFRKREHTFLFRWPVGQELDILNAIGDLAARADSGIDYYDATILYYRVGRRIRLRCGVGED